MVCRSPARFVQHLATLPAGNDAFLLDNPQFVLVPGEHAADSLHAGSRACALLMLVELRVKPCSSGSCVMQDLRERAVLPQVRPGRLDCGFDNTSARHLQSLSSSSSCSSYVVGKQWFTVRATEKRKHHRETPRRSKNASEPLRSSPGSRAEERARALETVCRKH